MKKVLIILATLFTVACGLILYVYFTNRTVRQILATDHEVASEWSELNADPPLSEFRMVAELVLVVPDYVHDPSERLPSGQFRLPDGRVAEPQIEGVDEAGNTVSLRHTGFTMSGRDSIRFSPKPELNNTKLVKIRIRSDVPFSSEKIFWLNRNMK